MRASQPVSAVAVLLACSLANCGPGRAQAFRSEWHRSRDHGWAGPAFWTNRLQDWRVQGGRLEAIAPLPLRTAHLLTRRLEDGAGDLELTATVGPLGVSPADTGRSSAGFLVGAGRGLDYRAAALIHHARGPSAGLYAGLDVHGRAFLRDLEQRDLVIVQTDTRRGPLDSATLRLTARARGATYEITLEAALWNASRDTIRVTTGGIPGERLVGGVALVSDSPEPDGTTFWFSHFTATGSKLARYDDRTVGPVIGTQHTLSRGRLKLTAQFMPLGPDDSRTARLQIADGRGWVEVATAEVVIPGYTATFGVADWDATRDAPFRVAYDLARTDGTVQRHYMHGTVRRDPIDQDSIVVAAFTGNHNVQSGVDRRWFPWGAGVWFPHADLVERVLAHDPDFLFFSGDQVYEGASPTRADLEHPFEDYLYKWYLWYWAFGRLTAEIPAVTIPDDHDVYHGNLWGAGGRATPPGLGGAAAQDAGGYKRSAEFVNMVQRTHASHLPDPHDPTPVEQGIGVYYTEVRYGGVSFAVLEDRKFKSAPAALLPAADIWNGWPRNREFDAKTQADVPGATLLGERQLAFLDAWAADWSGGVWMKVALSQTLFANVATLPDSATTGSVIPSLPVPEPGDYPAGDRIVTDMDSNGWPQTGRNRALRAMRKAFAIHLSGDQHLGSTVQYGIDDWGDAAFALCVPSVANFWPRRWFPPAPGRDRDPDRPAYTGRYEDGFGNKITVHAVSNPVRAGREPAALHDRAPGYGIARLHRRTRQVSLAAWPRWADPNAGDQPYPGWPVVVAQRDNYGRRATHWLPEVVVQGMEQPVIQLVYEATGEIVYTLRLNDTRFVPGVFEPGSYTIRIGEPGTERHRELTGIVAAEEPGGMLSVVFE